MEHQSFIAQTHLQSLSSSPNWALLVPQTAIWMAPSHFPERAAQGLVRKMFNPIQR